MNQIIQKSKKVKKTKKTELKHKTRVQPNILISGKEIKMNDFADNPWVL